MTGTGIISNICGVCAAHGYQLHKTIKRAYEKCMDEACFQELSMAGLFVIVGICLLFEIAYAWKKRFWHNFYTGYTNYIWLYLMAGSAWVLVDSYTADTSRYFLASRLVTGVVSMFFLIGYLLFRGIFVVFELSQEGCQHPTCRYLKRLMANKVRSYVFVTLLAIIANMNSIILTFLDYLAL